MSTIHLVDPATRDIAASLTVFDPERESLQSFRAQTLATYAQIFPAMPDARRHESYIWISRNHDCTIWKGRRAGRAHAERHDWRRSGHFASDHARAFTAKIGPLVAGQAQYQDEVPVGGKFPSGGAR